jgi:hypothetical protein
MAGNDQQNAEAMGSKESMAGAKAVIPSAVEGPPRRNFWHPRPLARGADIGVMARILRSLRNRIAL